MGSHGRKSDFLEMAHTTYHQIVTLIFSKNRNDFKNFQVKQCFQLKISQKIEKRNDFVCNDFVVGTVAGIFKIRFQNFRCWKISIYPNYLDLGHPNVESEFRKCLTPNLNKVFGYIYSAQIGLMINEVRYSSVQTSDTYVF